MNSTLNPAVTSFLKNAPIPLYIDGKWAPSEKGKTSDVLNPSDGSLLAKIYSGDAGDVDKAMKAGDLAFRKSGWSQMPANERAVYLHRLADLLMKNIDVLAELESLDVGKPINNSKGFDIPFAAQAYRYFADLSTHVSYKNGLPLPNMDARSIRKPYGVCGFIFPWNFPFILLAWGTAPALAAGNTVVVKPSSITPLSSLYFCKLAEEAGIPKGVVNVVPGGGNAVGTSLLNHPLLKRMSFTGSPEIGQVVGEACGKNIVPVKLELGGKGAAVVFDDVDIHDTAVKLAQAITLNTGQVCCTATRWFVQDKVYDKFVSEVVGILKNTKIGAGIDDKTEMGPVVSEEQRKTILKMIEQGVQEKAKAVLPAEVPSVSGGEKGFFITPSLLEGTPDNLCACREIFGPSAFLLRFKSEDEVVETVNASRYGLANSVWTQDIARANRVAENLVSGNSWINAHNVFAYGLPYGGVNYSGLGGGVNSPETFFDYLRHQTIARPL